MAFVQRTDARDEATLRPRMRSRGTQPAIASVTISGPFDVSAPGESPSRRRIFVCRPTAASAEEACARRILSTIARRAYRGTSNDADVERLMEFFRQGRKDASFDQGVGVALRRVLTSPHGRAIYQSRKRIEPVFGQIKHNRRCERFKRRGRAAARSEWRLITATHNLLKLHSHWTQPAIA